MLLRCFIILTSACVVGGTSSGLRVSAQKLVDLSEIAILRLDAVVDDPVQESWQYDPINVDGKSIQITEQRQALKPRVGRCYVHNEKLLNAVRLWREKQEDNAATVLKELVNDPNTDPKLVLLARHLSIDIGQLKDRYKDIKENAEAILKDDPKDVHALFVMGLYSSCANMMNLDEGNPLMVFGGSEIQEKAKELEKVSPKFSNLLNSVKEIIGKSWKQDEAGEWKPLGNHNFTNVNTTTWPGKKVIAIFGWGPVAKEEAGDGLPPMRDRIKAGLKLADAFPEAQIIASGGAVTAGQIEGAFIKKRLIEHEEEEHPDDAQRKTDLQNRIKVDISARDSQGNAIYTVKWLKNHAEDGATVFIVGSDWQNPRFKAIMEGTLKAWKLSNIRLVPYGAGKSWNDDAPPTGPGSLAERIVIERTAIWRDAARALGYFEYCDFESEQEKKEEDKEQETAASKVMLYAAIAVVILVCLLLCVCIMQCFMGKQEEIARSQQLEFAEMQKGHRREV